MRKDSVVCYVGKRKTMLQQESKKMNMVIGGLIVEIVIVGHHISSLSPTKRREVLMDLTTEYNFRKMYFWKVLYSGLYLGGTAVVIAETREEAIELVKKHKQTVNFIDYVVEQLPNTPPCVLYNWNGDY